jgi:hypothetical protein
MSKKLHGHIAKILILLAHQIAQNPNYFVALDCNKRLDQSDMIS